jgi:hypothetical protein
VVNNKKWKVPADVLLPSSSSDMQLKTGGVFKNSVAATFRKKHVVCITDTNIPMLLRYSSPLILNTYVTHELGLWAS